MKTNSKVLIIMVAMIFVASSSISFANGINDIKKENRKVSDFNQINMSIPADVYLTQGAKNEVIIEADEDVLAKIETEVRENELDIKFEKWYNYRGTKQIKVYITVKEINKLVLAGSGDIISKSTIKSEKLKMVITGSGSILIDDLYVKEVHANISGSGDIRIASKEKAMELDATITGSGNITASDLEFEKADLVITGSGTIEANVIDELDATITGSGRIYYKGKPLIDANVTGSGKIRTNN
ncbi:MAG: DUF2807 domain-containing protein [Bacteroidales bacterium]|nr:DUF2807 domain-containing protein [Bacteroidales bacterium]